MEHEPRPVIHMAKQLGWAHKFGGVESVRSLHNRSNSARQVDGVSDMTPACGLYGSVGGVFRKGTVVSACLHDRHFSFSQYATGAFQAATPVLELRGSESE